MRQGDDNNFSINSFEKLPRSIRQAIDNAYAASSHKVFQQCESPAERNLLHCLLKGYKAEYIFQQYKVGPYRLDFLTADGVGWEVDGKEYHNEEKDAARDTWILTNSEIRQIVRIQASAIHFFQNACLAVFSNFVAHMREARMYCDIDDKEALRIADDILTKAYEGDLDDEPYSLLGLFEQSEAYTVVSNVGYVGTPFAFLPDDHHLWKFLPKDRVNLNKYLHRITNRTQ